MTSEEATFHHNNQTSESQVDHIYFYIPETSKVKVQFKDQLCLKENPSNISSHDVIVGEIVLPVAKVNNTTEQDHSSSYTPFVVKKPKWNESGREGYQHQTARVLQELSDKFNSTEFLPTLCEMFSKALVISAEKNFVTSKPNIKKSFQKLPYFSKEYKEAHAEHKRVCADWRKAGRPSDLTHPNKAAVLYSRRNLQQVARNEESSKAINLNDDLMDTFNNDPSKIYSKMKKARG